MTLTIRQQWLEADGRYMTMLIKQSRERMQLATVRAREVRRLEDEREAALRGL